MEVLSLEAGALELNHSLISGSGAAGVAHRRLWMSCHHVEPTTVLVQSTRNLVSQKAEKQEVWNVG